MGLFSKEICEFCGKEAGMLGRKKLSDKKYICKECEKNCSAFMEPSRFDTEYLKQHMEYMKKQDELYKKAFEVLDKEQKERFVHEGYYGIVFADEIAMFEVVNPKANKKNFKELFRYDQIKDYEIYKELDPDEGGKVYSEVGVIIKMNCQLGPESAGMSDVEKKLSHPYVSEFKILCEKNTNSTSSTSLIIGHLNKIFGRGSDTVLGSIKESFTGTERERQGYKAGADALKAFGSFAKAKMSGSEEDAEAAKEKLNTAVESGFAYMSENRSRYTQVADSVEKNILGSTISETL